MERNLKNIIMPKVYTKEKFGVGPGRSGRKYPARENERLHGETLKVKFLEVIDASEEDRLIKVTIVGKEGFDLKLESLEDRRKKIEIIGLEKIEDKIYATIAIPYMSRNHFLNKIDDFLDDEKINDKNNRANKDLINSIDDITGILINSFWTDRQHKMPTDNKEWCEIWISYESNKDVYKNQNNINETVYEFEKTCKDFEIEFKEQIVIFAESLITLAYVNGEDIENLIKSSNMIIEIRKNCEPNQFFIDGINLEEKEEWIDDVINRIERTERDKRPIVCVLDTGIAKNHPLIKPFIVSPKSIQSAVEPLESTSDSVGHGTEMAGIAIYGDLKERLESNDKIIINHNLESVKILPDPSYTPNDVNLYGFITEQAVYSSEIISGNRNKIYCMAVTSDQNGKQIGSPTQWSSSLDMITYGRSQYKEDKRLFLVSAGNIHPTCFSGKDYPECNLDNHIQDPSQSWNTLSVGAYNNSQDYSQHLPTDFNPVAKQGQLSPYSTTSCILDHKSNPIKPEVLFDGGNMIVNSAKDYDMHDDYSLLTTSYKFSAAYSKDYFSVIHGTSSATAQASNFCSELWSVYPELWPETVKALTVHSASWTEEMKTQFLFNKKKTEGVRRLLRACGYGVPNLNRAIYSQSNSVTLINQSEIQPFIKDKSSSPKYNEMLFYELPWPKQELENLGNAEIRLRVTLCYFIEPSPDKVGWTNKYVYPSFRLGFDIQRPTEDIDQFKKRINKILRTEEEKENNVSNALDWFLGSQNRNLGSIYSDFIETTAIKLSDVNCIGVFPMAGWWKSRPHLKQYNNTTRFALIITLETKDENENIDLYTPIMGQINNLISV